MTACPRCSIENPPNSRFCNSCGASLIESAPREERKFVTIVFVDLVGFTARSESADPEDVRGVQRPYFARVREELERYGGTVEKFIGDAVMAAFGAPVAHEDDAERAVRAALSVRDALSEEGLQVRIGVNSGEALVSLDARPDAGESFVAGDVVNTAARLQSGAAPGTVFVGESTWRSTRDAIEYREADSIVAKGKSDPVAAWEAVAPRARLGVDVLQRGGAELVGRARERALLLDALARARSEREPQLATLVGVPGIGKSRLTYEVLRSVHDDPELITWRQGRCLAYGSLAFAPLAEIVKAHAGILDTDSSVAAEEKLRAVLVPLPLDEPEFVLGHLLALVGVAEAPDGERALAQSAWLSFLEALAADRPTVLVFEDLHWANDELLAFVEELVDSIRGVPLFLLCTARPELLDRRRDWGGGKVNAITLSLAPLSDEQTGELVSALLEQVLAPETQELLLQRAGGNPLYAEQFVRMLLEGGSDIPDNVQGIIAARIDSLAPEEKELLQRAAVVGKVFWTGIVGGGEDHLRGLERKDFIRRERRSSVAGEVEYAFRHVLGRDVAYGQIPRSRRWHLHVETARWLDRLSDRADRIEMVAHHYLEALELARATGEETAELRDECRFPIRDAALKVAEDTGWTGAGDLVAAALSIWPEEDADWAWLLHLKAGIHGVSAPPEHRHDEFPRHLQAFERLVELGDNARAARVATFASWRARMGGDTELAARLLAQARELVDESGDDLAHVDLLKAICGRSQMMGDAATVIESATALLELVRALKRPIDEANALGFIAQAKIVLGDPSGRPDLETCVQIVRETGAPQLLLVENNLGVSLVEVLGDVRAGVELHRDVLAGARRLRSEWLQSSALLQLAGESWWLGDWDEAVRLSHELLRDRSQDLVYMGSFVRVTLARIAAARGDQGVADSEARAALEGARTVGDAQLLDPALAAAARILRSDEIGDELLGLLEARGTPVPYCLADLAFALADAGRPEALLPALDAHPHPSLWHAAARAVAESRWDAAAELYDEIGALPEAAEARAAAGDTAGAAAFFEPRGAAAMASRV